MLAVWCFGREIVVEKDNTRLNFFNGVNAPLERRELTLAKVKDFARLDKMRHVYSHILTGIKGGTLYVGNSADCILVLLLIANGSNTRDTISRLGGAKSLHSYM
jgi:hypothetical protein